MSFIMKLDVLSDLSERVPYNISDFPVYTRIIEMKSFHKHSIACHWHRDLELCLPLKGDMIFIVNGESYHLKEGQGIFINSRRLHYCYSDIQSDCKYLCLVFNPFPLSKKFGRVEDLLDEKFGVLNEDTILLTGEEVWHNDLLQVTHNIYREMSAQNINPLLTLSLIFNICSLLWDNLKPPEKNMLDGEHWQTIWKMTGFIHKHYNNKVTLHDIAEAGSVCRTKCCELFKKHLSQAPIAYLNEYRIQKSCEILRDSTCPIIDVAFSCGFQSSSYYTYAFRKIIGCTPKEYRAATFID